MSDKKKIALAMVASSLALLSNGLQADEAPMVQIQEEELAYADLGSGEEVRSDLVSQANTSKKASHSKKTADNQCGDGSSEQNKGTKKPVEGQCGEGKCGDKKGGTGGTKQPAEGNCGETKSSTSSNQDSANRNMKSQKVH